MVNRTLYHLYDGNLLKAIYEVAKNNTVLEFRESRESPWKEAPNGIEKLIELSAYKFKWGSYDYDSFYLNLFRIK